MVDHEQLLRSGHHSRMLGISFKAIEHKVHNLVFPKPAHMSVDLASSGWDKLVETVHDLKLVERSLGHELIELALDYWPVEQRLAHKPIELASD